MKMIKIFEAINYLMALLFVFAAIMQYNDPDGLHWMGVYGLAAAFCILWAQKKMNRTMVVALAVISLICSALIVPADFTGREAFSSFRMQSIEVEEMREALGLLIVAIWMLALSFVPQKRAKEETAAAASRQDISA